MRTLDLGSVGLDRGGHLALRRALRALGPDERLRLQGEHPDLALHASVLARQWGCPIDGLVLGPGHGRGRWAGAAWAGTAREPAASALPSWGVAPRGAAVEAGAPAWGFSLLDRDELWTEEAARLYAQAAANQWDPNTAIDWTEPFELAEELEDAVVQVMTYLIENETAALIVPAHFCARLHPHFREVMQLLAITSADEARHIEVFTRRALLRRERLALSTVGGQTSLKTLVDEPDFALASFLLSVLGEGSFLTLLWFLQEHAPDPVTARICGLAARDEARHVAFGMAHLSGHAQRDPGLLARLAGAIEARHAALQHTAGLNEEVFDALTLLAAGSWAPEDLERGWDAVLRMSLEMGAGRTARLRQLGFDADSANRLAALHTRNFM